MSPLRARMIEDMSLAGLATGTQKIYVQAVRRLAAHYRRSPDLAQRGRSSGGYLASACASAGWRAVRSQTSRFGLRFFYHHTLERTWGLFGEKRSPRHRQKRLPDALSEDQIRQLLGGIRATRFTR